MMINACDAAAVKLFVVKQNRFNVPVIKAREALEPVASDVNPGNRKGALVS